MATLDAIIATIASNDDEKQSAYLDILNTDLPPEIARWVEQQARRTRENSRRRERRCRQRQRQFRARRSLQMHPPDVEASRREQMQNILADPVAGPWVTQVLNRGCATRRGKKIAEARVREILDQDKK